MSKGKIDDKNAKPQLMKYNNFDEWFNAHPDKDRFHFTVVEAMRKAWDTALNNFELEINIGEDTVRKDIIKLLTTINDAEKIDCTCDKKQIAAGYRCACGRGQASMHAGIELGKYLKKLREGLK